MAGVEEVFLACYDFEMNRSEDMARVVSLNFKVPQPYTTSPADLFPVSNLAPGVNFVEFSRFAGRMFLLDGKLEALCVVVMGVGDEDVRYSGIAIGRIKQ